MDTWAPWTERWEKLFYQLLDLTPEHQRRLPLSLRHIRLARVKLGEFSFIAAQINILVTPKVYRQYLRQLEDVFGMPVVFFLPPLTADLRRRLIQAGTPFFSRDGSAYIPQLYIHFSPNNAAKLPEPRDVLSPTAQALLLRQIIVGDLQESSLSRAAKILGYTPMSITNAKNELLQHKLCRYEGSKTRSLLSFGQDGQVLWQQAQDLLRSPVIKKHYINAAPTGLPLAGESALAAQTLLVDGKLPSYAIGKRDLRPYLTEHGLQSCDPEDAAAILEQWMYPPALLMSADSQMVDNHSLTLSLRDSQDDRVLQELSKLQLLTHKPA